MSETFPQEMIIRSADLADKLAKMVIFYTQIFSSLVKLIIHVMPTIMVVTMMMMRVMRMNRRTKMMKVKNLNWSRV